MVFLSPYMVYLTLILDYMKTYTPKYADKLWFDKKHKCLKGFLDNGWSITEEAGRIVTIVKD